MDAPFSARRNIQFVARNGVGTRAYHPCLGGHEVKQRGSWRRWYDTNAGREVFAPILPGNIYIWSRPYRFLHTLSAGEDHESLRRPEVLNPVSGTSLVSPVSLNGRDLHR